MTVGLTASKELINHVAMLGGGIGLGLVLLNHYLRSKEIEKMAKLITGRILPKARNTWRKKDEAKEGNNEEHEVKERRRRIDKNEENDALEKSD